jgi:hypothetical protein
MKWLKLMSKGFHEGVFNDYHPFFTSGGAKKKQPWIEAS